MHPRSAWSGGATRQEPPSWLIYTCAAVGAVAAGLPFALGSGGAVNVFLGLLCAAFAIGAAVRWKKSVEAVIGIAVVTAGVTVLGGLVFFEVWSERVRRDTSRDIWYAQNGVIVQADPGFLSEVMGDGPTEYCGSVTVDVWSAEWREKAGETKETVDGKLLASRCDLTPKLLDRLAKATDDWGNGKVEVVVVPELIIDNYDRPVLDGYRFVDELSAEHQHLLRTPKAP